MSAQPEDCSARRLVYSLSWAKYIVRKLYQTRARAPEIVTILLGLTDGQLAILLACRDPAWEIIRDMIKTWDSWGQQQERLNLIAPGELQLAHLIDKFKLRASPAFKKYLTERKNAIESKSRSSGKAGGSSTEDSPNLFPEN